MPIYAYRCDSCGHEKDVLRKLSDAPLTTCPACGKETFSKQVTAAGFQLKGSGWYVTDFRGGSSASNDGAAAKTESSASAGDSAKTNAAETVAPAGASSADSASSAAASTGGASAASSSAA